MPEPPDFCLSYFHKKEKSEDYLSFWSVLLKSFSKIANNKRDCLSVFCFFPTKEKNMTQLVVAFFEEENRGVQLD